RCFVARIGLSEEEDFARLLLADLPREERRPIAAVEASDVGVRLQKARVLTTRERQIAHDVQAVAAADGPSRDDGDDDLRHEADQALHFEDVEPAEPRRVDAALPLVFVAVLATNPLITARAERPTSVLRRRAVAGQKNATDVGRHARV